MPEIQVAQIWHDPWTKENYEGMAKLMSRIVDVPDKTIGAITCELWCVRFFYTEVSLRRWVDQADMTTWLDTVDRYVPIACFDGDLVHTPHNCQLRLEATSPAGVSQTGYFNCPALAVDEKIVGIGVWQRIHSSMHADSYVYIQLRCHDNEFPENADTICKLSISYQQSLGYIEHYIALDAVREIETRESYIFRITIFAKEQEEQNGWLYVKAPFIRLERTI